MTLSTGGYTVGANYPLNHARVLYAPIAGTVTADGTNGDYATNDYTTQRWEVSAFPANWKVVTAAAADVDMVFIAGHNLGTRGATVAIQTAASVGGAFTTRATVVPTDNTPIAALFNTGAGAAYSVRDVRIVISGATGAVQIAIIRAGKALQMQRPMYGGLVPMGWADKVTTQQELSESGQWLGAIVQVERQQAQLSWQHLEKQWVADNARPWLVTLPQKPFAIVQNPLRMPESVNWCWTTQRPAPETMGIRDLMSLSFDVTGYMG